MFGAATSSKKNGFGMHFSFITKAKNYDRFVEAGKGKHYWCFYLCYYLLVFAELAKTLIATDIGVVGRVVRLRGCNRVIKANEWALHC